ncbi:MAG: undecaprenyl diphosphate synthase family protein [Ilumatobacteraceae bacterium]
MTTNGMSHVMVCGGSVAEWAEMSPNDWRQRTTLVATAARNDGAAWVTIIPYTGAESDGAQRIVDTLVDHCGGTEFGNRVVVNSDQMVSVIVDPNTDGLQRIATAAASLNGRSISEDTLAAAVCAPAPTEPDLCVVLGPATQMPASLVWELAYAELVFLNVPWAELDGDALEIAISDFARRDRRFGGVDS